VPFKLHKKIASRTGRVDRVHPISCTLLVVFRAIAKDLYHFLSWQCFPRFPFVHFHAHPFVGYFCALAEGVKGVHKSVARWPIRPTATMDDSAMDHWMTSTRARRVRIEATLSLTTMQPPSPATSHPSPPTLRSLKIHVPDQEKCINPLLKRSTNPVFQHLDEGDSWVDLWRAAWNKDLDGLDTPEKVERDLHPIDNSLIPDAVPDERAIMLLPAALIGCWVDIECEKILVRSEYKEAEEFAVSACSNKRRYRTVMVTGQPGIGLFLFFFTEILWGLI